MKPISYYFLMLRHTLGISGLLGLALCLAAVGMLAGSRPLALQAQAQQAELVQLRSQPKKEILVEIEPQDDVSALESFYKQFPKVAELTTLMEDLHAIADEQGVVLSLGEYKLVAEEGGKLMRYDIQLPVSASYQHLRNFIAESGKQFPTLGLSEVNLKREAVGEKEVQVKLHFVLYLSGQH